MKAPATMECAAGVKAAPSETARGGWARHKPATSGIAPTVEARAAVKAAAVITVEPGASADKDAIHEPVRPVVAVGSAGVWIIVVVTIGTDRSRSINWPVNRPNAEPHPDTHLRLGGSGTQESQNSEKNSIFEVSHKVDLVVPNLRAALLPSCLPSWEQLTQHLTRVGGKSCRSWLRHNPVKLRGMNADERKSFSAYTGVRTHVF